MKHFPREELEVARDRWVAENYPCQKPCNSHHSCVNCRDGTMLSLGWDRALDQMNAIWEETSVSSPGYSDSNHLQTAQVLKLENAHLRNILAFYADPINWLKGKAAKDEGLRARMILNLANQEQAEASATHLN